MPITRIQVQNLVTSGGNVVGADGQKIGSIGQIYVDDSTGEPSFVTVKTGLFGTAESFVPLRDATLTGVTSAWHTTTKRSRMRHG